MVGGAVPVGTPWGIGVGEGLVTVTESIGAAIPEGATWGTAVPGELITVGVGVETGADVTFAAYVPIGLGIDMDMDMSMRPSSRKAL